MSGDWIPFPGVRADGIVRSYSLGTAGVVWGIESNGQIYEIVGGLDPSIQTNGLVVVFDGLFQAGTGVIPGSVLIVLLAIT